MYPPARTIGEQKRVFLYPPARTIGEHIFKANGQKKLLSLRLENNSRSRESFSTSGVKTKGEGIKKGENCQQLAPIIVVINISLFKCQNVLFAKL